MIAHLPDLALAAALAWGAGLRLYLVVFALGIAGWLGWLPLPEHLSAFAHPAVMAAAGFMTLIELFADKLPWLDSLWDGVQTFIRIPAGAAMAAAVFGDSGAVTALVAAMLGGGLTAATHFSKAGARAAVNTSPEPFSNLALSFGEDALVLGGGWLALTHPAIFLGALALLTVAGLSLIWILWHRTRRWISSRRA
ncbi:MAG: DUF4126 domain-containing protein [Burkholderiales bacterium]|jgi:hypothetical protein